ncbi:histidine kinase dimerization/phosphoacceptor domain-containing protein [Streptomyces johnsoniae]|uniref:histidine kinase n=1 Tax=Streptomyces johnsoniae TaxID=3075532 RepID=A0ABU2S671_9ACTN|nr:histidine kinase dimerization/phosphoacceptor domain-containing protein [Streptomyces sp. DSM 41886]MDT0444476.1 histidine kinase dimerization/phosphoacceptor domain-containing protein [Streptomyces sp. DSM 41886]
MNMAAVKPGPPHRRPVDADLVWAVLLLVLCGVNIVADPELRGWAAAASAVTALSLSLGVALRRRVPERTLVLALAVCLAQIVWSGGPAVAAFAVYAIVCAAADLGARWAVRLALIGGLGAAALAAVRQDRGLGTAVEMTVALSVPIALSWALGFRARCRRCYRRQLAERADGLAQLRSDRHRAAVADQRAEICREMYDLTGHRVAGMVVHAEAADRVLDAAPERAGQSLHVIATMGRESEAELRRARTLLRDPE